MLPDEAQTSAFDMWLLLALHADMVEGWAAYKKCFCMVTCCIFETTKDTCLGLLVVRRAVRALLAIASLLVTILPLVLLPSMLSRGMDVIHSEWPGSQ